MHRLPIQQRHSRTGWVWSAAALVVVVAAATWFTHTGAPRCAAAPPDEGPIPTPATAFPAGQHAAAAPTRQPQQQVAGEARYYHFDSEVACSYPNLEPDGRYVGLSGAEYGRADACGGYLDIHGPRGEVRALIVDRCPGCAAGELDLSAAAFERIAAPADGVVAVTYTMVRDPQPPAELTYAVQPDSSPQWLAILLFGAGNPVRQVAIRPPGGDWRDLRHGRDNYWTGSGAGTGPFAVRVTDVHGQSAEFGGVTLDSEQRSAGVRLYDSAPPDSEQAALTSPTASAVAHTAIPVCGY
ncbi:hypothetical protein D5S18_20160 [Nocardia panacis]|uniref:RlpA-like protein double-psi beta-barrel domain-containing protein n=1 Tax=Nocardia panacis TaxID=2340916 RepID=A0A3A4KUH7_9NOCA|nr:expansin EXLX1 family cellulose-binding protein [Nocardia panacis]RJO73524.1 hypothetical protein D5S18_20160 [Nocardia panacis]